MMSIKIMLFAVILITIESIHVYIDLFINYSRIYSKLSIIKFFRLRSMHKNVSIYLKYLLFRTVHNCTHKIVLKVYFAVGTMEADELNQIVRNRFYFFH